VITKEGSAGSTGQNYRVTDATGSVVSFVRNTSGIVMPEGGASSITGHLSIFNGTPQITIRSIDDVVNGGQVIVNPESFWDQLLHILSTLIICPPDFLRVYLL
jgi:DNA/RNA endonuclease YhcR with UshA esterase domain